MHQNLDEITITQAGTLAYNSLDNRIHHECR